MCKYCERGGTIVEEIKEKEVQKVLDELKKQDRELFLSDLKEGKIILADVETDKEGNTTYYYIRKIC